MSFLKYLIPASFLALLPTLSFAGSHGGNLDPSDAVGISFWIISIAMVAATVFFLMESLRVKGKWRTSLVVGALVTLVAGVHYFYMREVWVATGESPTVFRYVDWIITVPLQMIEFYLILAACTAIAGGVFLQEFVGDTPWVHMDIAGMAWGPTKPSYQPKNGATGYGVRIVYDLLENRIK